MLSRFGFFRYESTIKFVWDQVLGTSPNARFFDIRTLGKKYIQLPIKADIASIHFLKMDMQGEFSVYQKE